MKLWNTKLNVKIIITAVLLILLSSAITGIAHAQLHRPLWYNIGTDSAIECSDDEPGNPSPGPDMLGCPYDFMKHVGGSPQLVGSWHVVNQTRNGSVDRNLTGIMTFNHNGTMQFALSMVVEYDSNGDKSNTVNGSWGVNGNGHWLGIVAIGLLLNPLTNVEASTHHFESHLHGTSGSAHHHGGQGFIAGSFFKFHQHKQNPQ